MSNLRMNKIDLDLLSPLCRVIPRGDDAIEFVCPVSDRTKLNNQLFRWNDNDEDEDGRNSNEFCRTILCIEADR